MAVQEFVLTEEMRQQAIGLQSPPLTVEIEKSAICRFAEAIEDPNPLWSDEAVARKGRYGGIVASPTFLRSVHYAWPELPFSIRYTRLLDGGSKWEYFEPVRLGDRITALARIEDIYQKSGHEGLMLFVITLITYTNQFDEVVVTQRTTIIRY